MERIQLNGVEVNIEASENYIQINDISDENLTRIWGDIKAQYPGYELALCFRDVPVPTNALLAIGAEILDDCLAMRVWQDSYKPCNSLDVVPLEKADFAEFAALHDKLHPAPVMYWTSQRLLNAWDKWRIFVVWDGGKIIGYTMMLIALRDEAQGEIFVVEAESQDHCKALISAATGCAFAIGKSEVLFMVDRDGHHEYEATEAVGFRKTGFYMGYAVWKV